MLLESPAIHKPINGEWVKNTAFEENKFTDRECEVVANLANILRPFIPKKVCSSDPDSSSFKNPPPHVTLRAPIVMIANTILRATGYSRFCRRMAPQISAGSLQAMPLSATGLYEILCSAQEKQYDISGADGRPLTLIANVTSPKENKEAVFKSLFDISVIKKVCQSHGLTFKNR
jgi:hypothetical protein